jgi:hypothetical protein
MEVAAGSQRIDQAGLVFSTEGEAVDVADGLVAGGGFGAGEEGHCVRPRMRVGFGRQKGHATLGRGVAHLM